MFCFNVKQISILFLSFFFLTEAYANNEIINALKGGSKIVFIRHSFAPGNGDPDNIDLKKCDTQRNLNQEGIELSLIHI